MCIGRHIIVLNNLLSRLLGLSAFELGDAGRRLLAQETASPVATDLVEALVVVVLDSLDQLAQVSLVVGLNLFQSITELLH